MYRDFYGLVRAPFEMTPDPSFLVLSPAHREGLAMLHYALEARKGFVALTGEVGTGKTTLVHALLSQLKSTMPSAFIFNPRLEPIDFLENRLECRFCRWLVGRPGSELKLRPHRRIAPADQPVAGRRGHRLGAGDR